MGDQTSGQVIRGHRDGDPVADQNTNLEFFHFTGEARENIRSIIEKNPIIPSTCRFRNLPI